MQNLKFLIFVFIIIACSKKEKNYESSETIYSIDEINNNLLIGAFTTQNAWILKLDNQRNIIWQNFFSVGGVIPIIVKNVSDSGFVVLAGNKFIKFTKDNSFQFEVDIDCSGCYLEYVSELSNGDYLVVGQYYKDFLVARISKDGNLLWNKNFGSIFYSEYVIFSNVINDNILIFQYKTASQSKYIEILKLDQNGNQLDKIVRNLNSNYTLENALYLNNKFFIVGSVYQNGEYKGLFLVIDSLGNELYSKIYNSESILGIIKLNNDSSFLIYNFNFVSKINIYGDIDWYKTFSEGIWTAKFLSNNSILLGGEKISNDGYTDGYLINLDLNGNKNWEMILKP
ncbi:MAG: hypothetical protein ABIL76_01015 [candidate division WOR-3 bacterium]